MGSVQSDSTTSFHHEAPHRKNSFNRTRSNTVSLHEMSRRYDRNPCEDEDYGWYEDCDTMSAMGETTNGQLVHQALVIPTPVCEPPMYVLESSLETQQLWYKTAGQRLPQPEEERAAMEKVWKENFASSQVKHSNVVSSSASISSKACDSGKNIIQRGESKISNSVSMSFSDKAVSSMTIQMPSYRVVRGENHCMFAEYLIVITLGGRGTVPFGMWRRHSDFEQLARNIQDIVERMQELNDFRYTRLSWECVQRHKKWFRSLDAEYLALKCYLLERFMQDLLCETSSCRLICNFLGIQ